MGQPLLIARAHRLSLDRAPADAAHHGEGNGAAVLSMARVPDERSRGEAAEREDPGPRTTCCACRPWVPDLPPRGHKPALRSSGTRYPALRPTAETRIAPG